MTLCKDIGNYNSNFDSLKLLQIRQLLMSNITLQMGKRENKVNFIILDSVDTQACMQWG